MTITVTILGVTISLTIGRTPPDTDYVGSPSADLSRAPAVEDITDFGFTRRQEPT